jgi:CRP-like cAMP-binding protein
MEFAPELSNPRRRAELLEATKWANEFSFQEIEQFAVYLELLKAADGQRLIIEGGKEPRLLVVVQGRIEVRKRNQAGREKLLAALAKGDSVGEMSLIDRQPCSASAYAAGDCTLLGMSGPAFEQLLDERPRLGAAFALKLARTLSHRLRLASGALSELLP